MKIKILDVELIGDISYDMIGYSDAYKDIVANVRRVRPDIDQTQLRMLSKHLTMKITYSIKGRIDIKILVFRPGFIFDTASIPNWMKWFIDNDGPNMLIPSLYHDAGYGLNFNSRRFTDAMFRALVRFYGKKYGVRFYRLKAFIGWCGPASPVGKRIYNSVKPIDHFNFGLCYEQ